MDEQRVELDCYAWGDHIRRTKSGWSSRSVLGRIMDEGPGASAPTKDTFVPVEFLNESLLWVHQAYCEFRLTRPYLADLMLVCFAVRASRDMKARALKVGKSKMYADRRNLISTLAALSGHGFAKTADKNLRKV